MEFNYEQSIWGEGEANLDWSNPASFRLRAALSILSGVQPSGETSPNLSFKGEGARVLEVGCGGGQFIRAVKKARPELDCVGSDISQRAIEIARAKNDGVEYSVSTEVQLPFADASFDAVLIFDVLEHVTDAPTLLREIKRVLKTGGRFYCFVPCEGDNLSWWNWLRKLGWGKDLTKKYAGHVNYFSRRGLKNIFSNVGFKIDKILYSEHILGQAVGVVSFWLLEKAARKNKLARLNNEAYYANLRQRGGGVFNWLRRFINAAIYLESLIFSQLPSPNAHFFMKS